MNIEEARAVVAEGDAKYGRAFQLLCDWQYHALEALRDGGANSKDGFERMVAVPHDRIAVDGGKSGPWIGVRTLLDVEVIDSQAVAAVLTKFALPGHPGWASYSFPLLPPAFIKLCRLPCRPPPEPRLARALALRHAAWPLCTSPFVFPSHHLDRGTGQLHW